MIGNATRASGRFRITGLFFAGPALVQRAIPLVTLPIFGRLLTPGEYGRAALLTTIYLLGTTALTMGSDTFVFYAAHRGDGSPMADRLTAAARTVATTSCLVVGLSIGVAVLGRPSLAGIPASALSLEVCAAALYSSGVAMAVALCRNRGRLRTFASILLANTVVAVTAKLVLVVAGTSAHYAWPLGDLAGAMVATALAWRTLRPVLFRRGSLRRHPYLDFVHVGIPLVPSRLIAWVTDVSDRLLVVLLLGAAAGGVYALGAQVAAVAIALAVEMCRLTLPVMSRAGSHGPTADVRLVVGAAAAAVLGVAVMVGGVGPLLIHLLFPRDFAEAARLLPPLSTAAALTGLSYLAFDFAAVVGGRTGHQWAVNLTGATVAVVSNLLLLPVFGVMWAACSSILAYLVVFPLAAWRAGWFRIVRHRIGRSLVTAAGALAALSVPYLLFVRSNAVTYVVQAVLATVVAVVITAGVAARMGWLTPLAARTGSRSA